VATQQFRNSNAYAAPGDFAVRSYLSSEDNGAMRWSLICDVSKKGPGIAGAFLEWNAAAARASPAVPLSRYVIVRTVIMAGRNRTIDLF
jgi:hypothetical protein